MEESFMIDLSVSWNTSNPPFKKLRRSPEAQVGTACAITNNGEDMFALGDGRGYLYNVKSNSWKPFQNINFATVPWTVLAASDPETGIVYIPDAGTDLSGSRKVMLSADPRAGTVNSTDFNPLMNGKPVIAWSAHLKSLVAPDAAHNLALFTPSKVTESSDGWSVFNTTTGKPSKVDMWNCLTPAYNGSTLVYLGGDSKDKNMTTHVYVLDVVKGAWKQGPPAPNRFYSDTCAVSGDQFIAWGFVWEPLTETKRDSVTLVFNLKTNKWVSRYVAPPRPSTTTLQTPTTTPEPSDTSTSDKKPVIIVVAVAGILLAIILGLILRYHRRARQSGPDGPSTGSLDTKGDTNASEKGDSSSLSHARLHQGAFGAHLVSEHPHAIVDDPAMKRGVQEGASAIQIPPQHPHIMVDKQELALQIPPHHPHAIGKQELEE